VAKNGEYALLCARGIGYVAGWRVMLYVMHGVGVGGRGLHDGCGVDVTSFQFIWFLIPDSRL